MSRFERWLFTTWDGGYLLGLLVGFVGGVFAVTPACHNRPELTAYLHPSGELIPHRMSQPCKSWSTGDRATPVPVLEGWQCAGCRWLPRADVLRFAQITTDPRVMRELTELAA